MEQITNANGVSHRRHQQIGDSLRHSRCKQSGQGKKDIEVYETQIWKELETATTILIAKTDVLLKSLAFLLMI